MAQPDTDHQGPGSANMEGELRRLSLGGAGLFALLAVALIVVLESLGTQLSVFEEKVVPTERAVGGMFDSISDLSARESAALAATAVDEVDALGDDAEAAQAADAALWTLEGALRPGQLVSLRQEFDAFRESADNLTVAARDSHKVGDAFAAQLSAAQSQVEKLLRGVSALEGEVQLRYILLLRELDSSQSTDALERLIKGDVRMIDERVGKARTMIEILGRRIEQVALTRNRDELNSLNSNELAQAAASAKAAINHLSAALDEQEYADLTAEVADVSAQLSATLALLHATGPTPGLVDLRHAYFIAGATMRSAQAAGRERSLSASATLEEVGADVRSVAEASQAQTDAVVRTTRIGVTLLVLLGLGFCAFSARRILMALKALRAQNAHLAKLKDDLSEANAHLEARVEERTKELSAREASTRLLLNSMGDGVFEANAQGILVGERSKAVDAWFGDRLDQDGSRVWNILSGDTPGAVSVQLGWEQLFDGFLPFEVAADQIPHRFERDGRIFDVEYREGAQESTVLVVVRDWTADVAAERAERESREFQALVGNLLRDRKGFEITRDECAHLIEQLEQAEDLSETKKALHTLKGNTASYGFSAVAKRCHSMENTIAAEGVAPTASELAALRREWELSIRGLKEFIQSEEGSSIQVESEEVEQLCRLLSENKDREEVLRLVATWAHTPARSYLTRLERQARRAASRLAKEVDVRVNHNRVRVDSSLDPLWPSLIHLVRNSIDHGLESPEVREAEGKPRTGKLAFSVEKSDRSILIEVADDGAGIDEASLRARLGPKSEGLPLLQVIAHDGLSSKDEVTDHSGRGVGFGAVLSVVESLGGTVSVSTAVGKGTCVQLQLPLVDPTASDATAAA